MSDKDLYFLLYLTKKAGLDKVFNTTTGEIAKELSISQQTVSRKLLEFAQDGIILRRITPAGMALQITEKGGKIIAGLYGELQQMFGKQIVLRGVVKDGMGEGRFYMSQKGYKRQFNKILGFMPYEGTLNISIDKFSAESFLATKKQLYITGFTTKERSFGGLKCYPVLIQKKISGALIVPDRTVHSLDTIEIIAPVYLREQLKLGNGKEIIVF